MGFGIKSHNIERINDEKTKIWTDRHNNFLCEEI